MDITIILNGFGYLIYTVLGLLAVWGIYNAILVYRGIAKKDIESTEAAQLLQQVGQSVAKTGEVKQAVELCQNPPYWHTGLAQLMAAALKVRHKGLAKIKQLLVMEFHTEVLSGLENRLASVNTASKLGPLLGLLGTVVAMIAAFGRIGGERADPSGLASDISLGLWTTAAGLLIATPLMMLGNDIQARLRSFRDKTERHLQDFLEVLEQHPGPGLTATGASTAAPAARQDKGQASGSGSSSAQPVLR